MSHNQRGDYGKTSGKAQKAFNALPGKREKLLRIQESLPEMEEVKRRIQGLEDEEEQIHDQMDEYAETGEEIEKLDGIKERLMEIKAEKEDLLVKKSDRDVAYAKISMLLSLTDSLEGKEPEEKEWPPECREYVDFMERTREKMELGAVRQFSGKDVQRYVEKVIVKDCTIEVAFKAGVRVEVES